MCLRFAMTHKPIDRCSSFTLTPLGIDSYPQMILFSFPTQNGHLHDKQQTIVGWAIENKNKKKRKESQQSLAVRIVEISECALCWSIDLSICLLCIYLAGHRNEWTRYRSSPLHFNSYTNLCMHQRVRKRAQISAKTVKKKPKIRFSVVFGIPTACTKIQVDWWFALVIASSEFCTCCEHANVL